MPPKADQSNSANGVDNPQKGKDAMFLFDSLFHATDPIVINVVEIANKTSQKVPTVSKRFSVIRTRYPGLDIQTTTTGGKVGMASADGGSNVPATPTRKVAVKKAAAKPSTPAATKAKAKAVKKSEVMVNDDDDEVKDKDDSSSDEDQQLVNGKGQSDESATSNDGTNGVQSNAMDLTNVQAEATLSNSNDSATDEDATDNVPASKKTKTKATPSKGPAKTKAKTTSNDTTANANAKRKRNDDGATATSTPKPKKPKVVKATGSGRKTVAAKKETAKTKKGAKKTADAATAAADAVESNDENDDFGPSIETEVETQANSAGGDPTDHPSSVKEEKEMEADGDGDGHGHVKPDLALDVVKQYADKSRKTPISKTITAAADATESSDGADGADAVDAVEVVKDDLKVNGEKNKDKNKKEHATVEETQATEVLLNGKTDDEKSASIATSAADPSTSVTTTTEPAKSTQTDVANQSSGDKENPDIIMDGTTDAQADTYGTDADVDADADVKVEVEVNDNA